MDLPVGGKENSVSILDDDDDGDDDDDDDDGHDDDDDGDDGDDDHHHDYPYHFSVFFKCFQICFLPRGETTKNSRSRFI